MARPKGISLTPEHKAKLVASNTGRKGHRLPKKLRVCESCASEYQPNAVNQRWCKTCAPDPTSRGRLGNYGVSKPIWDKMLVDQGGHCALCPNEPTMVDHDHKTDVVRGLLCRGCNIALNRAEMADWIFKVSSYLLRGKN
jgi:Pyruvate/2-oxoacid:ferredoxin oxidoreductase delta subunit